MQHDDLPRAGWKLFPYSLGLVGGRPLGGYKYVKDMNALTKTGQAPTMTSLELVEFINSQRGPKEAELTHANFLAKVPKVLGDGGLIKFQDTYTHHQNGQQYPCYRLPKREACLMSMSYSYELQAKVFDRMTALESAPALPSYTEALRQLADNLERNEALTAQALIDGPKAKALDRIATSDGALCIRDAAKALQIGPKAFTEWLLSKKWIYRREDGGKLVAYQDRLDSGVMTHKVVKIERADGSERVWPQALVTPKGLAKLSKLFEGQK